MERPSAAAVQIRALALAPTVLVHGLIVLLLIQEDNVQQRKPIPERAISGVWIFLHTPAQSATDSQPPGGGRTVQPRPSALAPADSVDRSQFEQLAPPSIEDSAEPAAVDWYGEASRLAEADRQPPASIGTPMQGARKPCKPRDSSFDWHPQEERYGLRPLPYVMVGERCVIGLGFGGCSLSALPEPNKRLFDDMRNGRTPESSVPHHEACE